MTKPKFSIRALLLLTGIVALACVVVVNPSFYWIVAIPFVMCIWTVIAMHKAFGFFRRAETFWLSALVGMLFYWASSQVVFRTIAGNRTRELFIATTKWNFQAFGEVEYGIGTNTFVVLHFIAGAFMSLVAAYVAQLIWTPKE